MKILINLTSETNVNQEEADNNQDHQVIHKKDEDYIYVRQDKYKGELKSKSR